MEEFGTIIIFAALLRMSVTDIKTLKIENSMIFLCALVFFCFEVPFKERIFAFLISFILIPFFGFGDVLLFSCLGFSLGFSALLFIFICSTVASGIISSVKLLLKKTNKKRSIAFAPFICFGFVIYSLNIWFF